MAKSSTCVVVVDAEEGHETAKRRGGVALDFTGSESGLGDDQRGQGLQARFERFKQEKVRERRLQRALAEQKKKERLADPEFKAKLRARFVGRALSYNGAPYHRKYFPDLPDDTLFLDCCGLIRQVLRDLAPDFGFQVGCWNQAYQLDTLPIAVEREELVPGDLVFWTGKYINPHSKPQKLNCVHVEIYLGTHSECLEKLGLDVPQLVGVPGANATLGSRTGGYVQVHETYENKPSTQYVITSVFFRSIDTWLDGVCEGHTYQWGRPKLQGTVGHNKSVFVEEVDEECASDNDAKALP